VTAVVIRVLWFAAGAALAAHLAGVPYALLAAAVIAAAPAVRFLPALSLSRPHLGFEVRVAYVAIVALQVLPGLAILTATQIVATAALVFFDYCFLARTLSFLPWHRRGPLTWSRVRATYLMRPTKGGNVLEAIERAALGTGERPA
jgi:hypothetical protein